MVFVIRGAISRNSINVPVATNMKAVNVPKLRIVPTMACMTLKKLVIKPSKMKTVKNVLFQESVTQPRKIVVLTNMLMKRLAKMPIRHILAKKQVIVFVGKKINISVTRAPALPAKQLVRQNTADIIANKTVIIVG